MNVDLTEMGLAWKDAKSVAVDRTKTGVSSPSVPNGRGGIKSIGKCRFPAK